MFWDDFFDSLFGGSGGAPQIAFNMVLSHAGYIGQYLGAYAQVRDGMPGINEWIDDPFAEPDPSASLSDDISGQYASSPRFIDQETGASSGSLLSNPNLRADNTSTPGSVSNEGWLPVRPEDYIPIRPGQENALDAPESIPEVTVLGTPPVRSRSSRNQPSDMPLPTDLGRSRVFAPDPEFNRLFVPKAPEAPRPEIKPAPRPEIFADNVPAPQDVQWATEVVIEEEAPEQSDPAALEAAEGRGRIQWGDLTQLFRGGFNGLVSISQEIERQALQKLAGPALAPFTTPFTDPIVAQSDSLRLTIDRRYGGAAIMGEQLAQNLAFEALPYAPQLGRAARRLVSSERVIETLASPAFWFLGAGGPGGGRGIGRVLRAGRNATTYRFLGYTPVMSEAAWADYQVRVGSPYEAVFEMTRAGKKTLIYVDTIEGNSLVEAKLGDMGQMWIPEREAHIHRQVQNYLGLAEAQGFGIEYRVSTKLGAERLEIVFARDYPSAVQSGLLTVKYVP